MNAQGLERAYPGFRRGYWDATCNRKPVFVCDPGMFYEHDYIEGYEAGLNDQYWAAQLENRSFDQLNQDAHVKAWRWHGQLMRTVLAEMGA